MIYVTKVHSKLARKIVSATGLKWIICRSGSYYYGYTYSLVAETVLRASFEFPLVTFIILFSRASS